MVSKSPVPATAQDPDAQDPCFPRHVYSIAWTEDADSGLFWCEDENEVDVSHSPALSHEADKAPMTGQVQEETHYSEVCHDVTTKDCSQQPQHTIQEAE